MKRILLGLAVLFSISMLACDQPQAPSSPSSGPANKASIDREFEFWVPVYFSCCGVDEEVLLSGIAKEVANDNGRHYVVKDLVGTCWQDGHTYTTVGTSVGNVRDLDDGLQVVFNVKLLSEEGCRIMVKMHFREVYNEETHEYEMVFDHSEVICEPGDET